MRKKTKVREHNLFNTKINTNKISIHQWLHLVVVSDNDKVETFINGIKISDCPAVKDNAGIQIVKIPTNGNKE